MSIGWNDPCPCGSRKKYKKCCMNKQQNHEIKRVRQRRFLAKNMSCRKWCSDFWMNRCLTTNKQWRDGRFTKK